MDRAAQMEAARILAQEFKSGGNSRRAGGTRGSGRDGLRGGGGTYGVGAGRSLNNPRSEFSRSPMNRPMPTSSRSALSVGNANKTPTRINPSLAGWLGGQSTDQNKPAKSAPVATKEATVTVPVDTKLASWLTNSSQSQPPSTKQVPKANATIGPDISASEIDSAVGPAAFSQNQTILKEPMRVTAQTQSPTSSTISKTHPVKQEVSDSPFEKKATSTSKGNGPAKSIRASENSSTVHTQGEINAKGPVVDTATSSQASDIPQGQHPVCSTVAAYDGQVSRLLETDYPKDNTQKAANKTGSNLQLRQQPKVGTLLWALQHIEAGLELPDPQQIKAHGYQINDNGPRIQSVAASQSDDVRGTVSQGRNQKTENDEGRIVLTDEISCDCPKRSHPVIGLAASKHNMDIDGDVDISGMSTTARNKFAVNVILHDHSKPDCPVLLRTKMKYPLYFGANPATVDNGDDGLNVTVWEGPHQATPPTQQLRQSSSAGRGLMSSIWAD
ncbi:uncharacterized protein LY79DRAFT_575741 [Colletotrichum navitas]|uniref:Uncharacterized protein n=1 Tax=Colletotrichum navitas TaxID=681940 RepID=A0AAD8QCK8_9PEZI|nr:uncharacterized protein LY79DRAFT_575741 [Colletotrichum navitas]KAK1598544.1 hypothetical protein LY79DRAFT_575741 [Colletotrichum navitas]